MNRNGGTTKPRRQRAILSLVAQERLASQEEIRSRLRALGLDATQSTISRDVEELGLARVHDHQGLRYVVPGRELSRPVALLRHALGEFAVSFVQGAGGLLVIGTPPGAANALAEAVDRTALPEIAGTVAGDNTILVIPREGSSGAAVEATLRRIREGKAVGSDETLRVGDREGDER